MEFADAVRAVLTGVGFLAIMLGASFGIKRLLGKAPRQEAGNDQLASIDSRLAGIEARMGELEERLDFAERTLSEVRAQMQLPGKR